jgi:hypothetical protein
MVNLRVADILFHFLNIRECGEKAFGRLIDSRLFLKQHIIGASEKFSLPAGRFCPHQNCGRLWMTLTEPRGHSRKPQAALGGSHLVGCAFLWWVSACMTQLSPKWPETSISHQSIDAHIICDAMM